MMKRLSLIDRLIFLMNSLFSAALLLAYILPFIPPKTFPFLSLLSLGVPFLIIANLFFLVYWVVRMKRQMILPLLVLLIGLHHLFSLFSFSPQVDDKHAGDEISIMSYNVRLFNKYRWIKEKEVPQKIKNFISEQDPDILCIQDYYKTDSITIENFEYAYIQTKGENATSGHAIFSKYPIINKGSLDFPDTFNNAIFADIVLKGDTVRVFNVHLESLSIIPEEVIEEKVSGKLIHRVGKAFVMQQEQTALLMETIRQTPYKSVICADMNNSAFSYVYRKIEEGGFKDTFKEAGNGFGKTYDFEFIPLRIDVIFVEDPILVTSFENFEVKLSDHYPIMAKIAL